MAKIENITLKGIENIAGRLGLQLTEYGQIRGTNIHYIYWTTDGKRTGNPPLYIECSMKKVKVEPDKWVVDKILEIELNFYYQKK